MFSPGHFPFLIGRKPVTLPQFIGFQWVELAGPLGNFWNFDRNYQTNTVINKTVGKTSIPFPLSFSENIAVSISNTNNCLHRLKWSMQTRNGRESRWHVLLQEHILVPVGNPTLEPDFPTGTTEVVMMRGTHRCQIKNIHLWVVQFWKKTGLAN